MTDPAPRLRLLPAPDPEPPYDDERAPAVPPVHGSLALAFPVERPAGPLRLGPPAPPPPPGRPAPPPPPPPPRGGAPAHPPGPEDRPDIPPLPEPRGWPGRLPQVLAEILAGARQPAQLARFVSLDVLDQLERPSSWRAHRPGQPPVRPVVRHVRID